MSVPMIDTARDLVRSSSPLISAATGVPFLIGSIDIERGLNPVILIGTLYFLVPYRWLIDWVEDLFDAETEAPDAVDSDRRVATWVAVAVTNLPFLVAIAVLAPPAGTAAVLLSGFAALAWSVPPLRTKEVPVAASLTWASHRALPALAGCLVAGGTGGTVPWAFLLAFLAWGTASHAAAANATVDVDAAAGRRTIATVFGLERTASVALGGYAFAALVSAISGGLGALAGLALATFVFLPIGVIARPTTDQAKRMWRAFPGLCGVVGVLLFAILLVRWGIVSARPVDIVIMLGVAPAAACLVQTLANGWALRRTRRRALERSETVHPSLPRLAVVLSVGREPGRLPQLLTALAQQDHHEIQIVAVVDGSDDAAVEAARVALTVGRPDHGAIDRVVAAPPRPPGWADRGWLSATGMSSADTDHVLLLDPAVEPSPAALRTMHEIAMVTKAALVSGWPGYAMPGPVEQAVVPGIPMTIHGLTPLWASVAGGDSSRWLAFAHGAVLLVDRAAYLQAGGHAAAASSEREGIDLARTMAGDGRRVRLVWAADLFTSARYANGTAALAMWRDRTLAGAGDSIGAVLVLVAAGFAAWLLPLIVAVVGWLSGDSRALTGGLLALTVLVAFRVVLAILERQPLTSVLYHPVTAVTTVAAQLASLVDGVRGPAPTPAVEPGVEPGAEPR
jgi:4-hydroxybenzoate polyprenyltransferase